MKLRRVRSPEIGPQASKPFLFLIDIFVIWGYGDNSVRDDPMMKLVWQSIQMM